MRTIVKGKNIDVPDRTRAYAERKMARLERYLDDRTDAIVELSTEKHRSAADSCIVEVTLVINGETLRGRAAGPTHKAGIDEVVDKMERRAVDFREKPRAGRVRPPEEKELLRKIADGTADEVPSGASSRPSASPSSRCSRRTRSSGWTTSATTSSSS